MVEYYVDDHVIFQNEWQNLPFGGNLSIIENHPIKNLQ